VAEAVAGSLQEAERAGIIGTRTLGKGSLSVFKELSDGSAIYLPISLWYTPGGKLIQGNGVEPDIEVALTVQDIQQQIDSQLSEAYNYLDGLLPHFR
jgi:carboxyl-terminal processing protease